MGKIASKTATSIELSGITIQNYGDGESETLQ